MAKFKSPLLIWGSIVTISGSAYFALSKTPDLEKPISKTNELGPKWLNKLKNVDSESLSDGMKVAQFWAKEGHEEIAKNWIDLICNFEKTHKPEEQEFCNKEVK